MPPNLQKRQSPRGSGLIANHDIACIYGSNFSGAEVIAQCMPRFRRTGDSFRGPCPACDDRKAAFSWRDGDNNATLLHCFRNGCSPESILAALGLRWADVQPPRTWPLNAEESRAQRKAIREHGWAAALSTISFEAKIAAIGARTILTDWFLTKDDYERLALAVARLDQAAEILCRADSWRPEVRA